MNNPPFLSYDMCVLLQVLRHALDGLSYYVTQWLIESGNPMPHTEGFSNNPYPQTNQFLLLTPISLKSNLVLRHTPRPP